MLSERQQKEILEKYSKILQVLPQSKNISEISEKTGIPTSTIQRYLTRKDLLQQFLTLIGNYNLCDVIYETNQAWLKNAKEQGNKTGGRNSQINHGYSKDENGQFKGSGKGKK